MASWDQPIMAGMGMLQKGMEARRKFQRAGEVASEIEAEPGQFRAPGVAAATARSGDVRGAMGYLSREASDPTSYMMSAMQNYYENPTPENGKKFQQAKNMFTWLEDEKLRRDMAKLRARAFLGGSDKIQDQLPTSETQKLPLGGLIGQEKTFDSLYELTKTGKEGWGEKAMGFLSETFDPRTSFKKLFGIKDQKKWEKQADEISTDLFGVPMGEVSDSNQALTVLLGTMLAKEGGNNYNPTNPIGKINSAEAILGLKGALVASGGDFSQFAKMANEMPVRQYDPKSLREVNNLLMYHRDSDIGDIINEAGVIIDKNVGKRNVKGVVSEAMKAEEAVNKMAQEDTIRNQISKMDFNTAYEAVMAQKDSLSSKEFQELMNEVMKKE